MTPAERTLRARTAAYTQWAKTPNRTARTANARAAANARFDQMVIDAHGELPPEEHAKCADAFRSAYYASLALKSAKARRANSGSTGNQQASTA